MEDVTRIRSAELSEEAQNEINTIKQMGNDFIGRIDANGSNRELSIAKTKMEEAVMWAVKGLTRPRVDPPHPDFTPEKPESPTAA